MARRGAAALLLPLLLAAGAHASIVQSDSSDLCTTNLGACQQQCASAGQFAFQCDQGGTFSRPTSTCKCVQLPAGTQTSVAQLKLVQYSGAGACGGNTWLYDCAQAATAAVQPSGIVIQGGAGGGAGGAGAGAGGGAGGGLDAGAGLVGGGAGGGVGLPGMGGGAGMGAGGLGGGMGGAGVGGGGMGAGAGMGGGMGAGAGMGGGMGAGAGGFGGGMGGAGMGGAGMGGTGMGGAGMGGTGMGGAGMGGAGAGAGVSASSVLGMGRRLSQLAAGATLGAGPAPAARGAGAAGAGAAQCAQAVQGVVTGANAAGLLIPGFRQIALAAARGNDTLFIQLPQPECTAVFKVVQGRLLTLQGAADLAAAAANATAAGRAPDVNGAAPGRALGALVAAAAAGAAALLAL